MAGKLTLWLATVALALGAASAQAQPVGLAPDVAAVFNRWMLASCIGGDERALAESLRRYPQPLTSAFGQALAAGPSAEELAAVRAGAEARYESRAKFPLSEFRIAGVSNEDLARFNRVARSEYVDDQVKRFADGYRSNALAGLGVIGTPDARAQLERIAGNREHPLAGAAREALKGTR